MFSAYDMAEHNPDIKIAVTHPGITFTNITAHYPKLLFAIIKHPMKIIFMPPKRASLGIIMGLFEETENFCWIGPRLFNIWGMPKKIRLKTCSYDEARFISNTAKEIYENMI